MDRYHRINLESTTRCKICQDIELYIELLTDKIEDIKELQSWVDGASSIDFLNAEIKDLELQVKVAQRVIDEILSNLRGCAD